MKNQKFSLVLSRSFVIANIITAAVLGCTKTKAAEEPKPAEDPIAPAEVSAAASGLFQLIDAANYAKEDKEALKAGLSVAIPTATTNEGIVAHVSQETVDLQIKKSTGEYTETLAFVSRVAQYIAEKELEFTRSEKFQQIPVTERDSVATYLTEVSEQYRARALETLFARFEKSIAVPEGLTPSVTNSEYRRLLNLAAKAVPPDHGVQLARGQRSYVLQLGDSLAYVARKHGVSTEAILKANPGLVPVRMRQGQVLVIPPSSPATGQVSSAPIREAALSNTR